MESILTPKLRLVPATAELVQLEMENLPGFFSALGVEPISDWPSSNITDVLPFFLEQLTNRASLVGWLSWYWIVDSLKSSHLVGGGGFKGAPTNGSVEIGYETRPAHRRTGIATEAVGAQVTWALEQPGVDRVVAETSKENGSSIGVLRRLGFVQVGVGSDKQSLRFERQGSMKSKSMS